MIFGTLIAQFGDGLQAPAENIYTQAADTDPLSTLEIFISNMVGLITVVGGIIFIYYFILAALNMISAGGDAGKLNTSREKMTQAALGLAVLVASYAIVGLIGNILGLDILSPKELLEPLIPV